MSDRLVLPAGLEFPHTLLDVSIEFDTHIKSGKVAGYKPIPTGFDQLDHYLGGGLVPESLVLVGGPPGTGKTVFVLQVARNIAAAAADNKTAACVVCFEHGEVYLYHRLLCMESVVEGNSDGLTMDDIRRAALRNEFGEPGLEALLETFHTAKEAWSRIVQYWERLYLSKGHPVKTTLNVLDTYLSRLRSQYATVVLFVDYLQKIPVFSPGIELTPERQIRTVTEGLKNLALAHCVPIVAVAAADTEGLKDKRVRFEDLWGGSSVNYEPDVAIMLNPTHQEAEARGVKINFSIEKNRLGPTSVEFCQVLRGQSFRFHTAPKP
jgi:replicative DNA helicase